LMGHLDQLLTIFASVPEGGIKEWNTRVAKACVKAGLGVILLRPGSKEPACTLTTAQAKTADDAAHLQGLRHHECGFKHAIIDVKEFTHKKIKDLLDAGCNIGIVPGAGEAKVIVVDVDTAAEVDAFLTDWAKETTTGTKPTMTVSSPGSWARDRNGFVMDDHGDHVWAHHGGGHYWLTTDQDLPADGLGKYRAPSGWTAMFRDCYVLIPPSIRGEGPYRAVGEAQPAPAWLLDRIRDAALTSKRSWLSGDLRDAPGLDEWSREHPGSEIAATHGYQPYSHDQCGCPTWTRPGDASHLKSITTCEVGCGRFDTSRGWGPVHIWSDAIDGFEGGETITPLQFLARLDYNGDTRAAMAGEEIAASPARSEDSADPFDADLWAIMGGAEHSPKVRGRSTRP
jgi:hypothetical protein